uniref:Sesquipedalian n=1 Tax=Astyanax mexicanus TaxID=7994 RepID=A0A3B1KA10_ASTMX
MKLNERSVAHYATCNSPPDKTGFLWKKGERNPSYHRRWCVLKGNMLFYFEERESREPVGLLRICSSCCIFVCESKHDKFCGGGGGGGRLKPVLSGPPALQGPQVPPSVSPEEGFLSLGVPGKENGVSWNKPAGLVNGEGGVSGVVWETEGQGDSARPPPIPPRRKTPGGSLESPVSPETGCFSKLHDWYGREVAELRVEWLQSQSEAR